MNQSFLSLPIAGFTTEKRARFLFRIRKEKARFDDVQLAATQSHGVLSQKRYMEITGNKVVAALAGTDNFDHVEEDDFVISLRTFEGGIERATERGCISPAYTVLKPSPEVEPKFYQYLLKSQVFISHLQTTVTGIRDGKSVKFENFANIVVPVPDLPTQRAIADFLDRETARIDLLIEKKQRLVDLVSPRFEALIHAARESGEWRRFGFSARAEQRSISKVSDKSFVPLGLYNRGRGFFRKSDTDFDDLGDSSFFFVKRGDLVFSGQFAWEGAVGFVSSQENDCVVSHRYPVYVGIDDVRSDYLYAYFRSHHGRFLMDNCSRGAAGRNRPLNTRLLEKEKIPIPSIELQNEVAEIVEFESNLKAIVSPSIDRLREYRSALITAAVTGQIDVKKWAKAGAADRNLDAVQATMNA
ncbi:MAG: restriction endonuclease subunit S [Hyphomonadaceae bacterium]